MRRIFPSLLLFLFAAVGLTAQNTPQRAAVDRILASSRILEGATFSFCALTTAGDTLVCLDEGRLMNPASTQKLITTGVALGALGGDYRFVTQLAADGKISGGILRGNVYIIGGADPTLGSPSLLAAPQDSLFASWAAFLSAEGIQGIEGHIVGDGRGLDGMRECPNWQWDDLGTYYGTGVSGLQWHENYVSVLVGAGEHPGDPLQMEIVGPKTPWMQYRFDGRTGQRGSGDQLYLYTTDTSPYATFRGTYAQGRPSKKVKVSNKFPERTCAQLFSEYLTAHGVENGGACADDMLPDALVAPASVRPLGYTQSAPLSQIVRECNTESNNLYAETLFRMLGRTDTGSAVYDSCVVALNARLAALVGATYRPGGAHLVDGCGLARKNALSAGFMCDFLLAMYRSAVWGDFNKSLPRAGSAGTVKNCLRLAGERQRQRVRLKSGSMEGIRCYAGYVLPLPSADPDAPAIVFSVMLGQCYASEREQRTFFDAILSALL